MTAQARFRSWIAFPALLVLGLAAPAHGETVLITPSVTAPLGDAVRCRIVNGGMRAIEVRVELRGPAGGLYLDDDLVVQAGTVESRGTLVSGPAMDVHCRFAGNFKKSSVRASIDILSSAVDRTTVVAPAQ